MQQAEGLNRICNIGRFAVNLNTTILQNLRVVLEVKNIFGQRYLLCVHFTYFVQKNLDKYLGNLHITSSEIISCIERV